MYDPVWNTVAWLGMYASSLVIIVSTNVLLVVHALHQASKMKRTRVWSKNVKLILQLLVVTILYCIFWIPNVILQIIIRFIPPQEMSSPLFTAFQNLILAVSLTPLICPFVCLAGMPIVTDKIKRFFRPNCIAHIHPLPLPANPIHLHINRAFMINGMNK